MIADFDVCEAMLRQFIDKVLRSRFSRPRLVMCAPSGITDVERRSWRPRDPRATPLRL